MAATCHTKTLTRAHMQCSARAVLTLPICCCTDRPAFSCWMLTHVPLESASSYAASFSSSLPCTSLPTSSLLASHPAPRLQKDCAHTAATATVSVDATGASLPHCRSEPSRLSQPIGDINCLPMPRPGSLLATSPAFASGGNLFGAPMQSSHPLTDLAGLSSRESFKIKMSAPDQARARQHSGAAAFFPHRSESVLLCCLSYAAHTQSAPPGCHRGAQSPRIPRHGDAVVELRALRCAASSKR